MKTLPQHHPVPGLRVQETHRALKVLGIRNDVEVFKLFVGVEVVLLLFLLFLLVGIS